jgi:hypothetical protein
MVLIQIEFYEVIIEKHVIQRILGNLLWKNTEKIIEIFQKKKEENIKKYDIIEFMNVLKILFDNFNKQSKNGVIYTPFFC